MDIPTNFGFFRFILVPYRYRGWVLLKIPAIECHCYVGHRSTSQQCVRPTRGYMHIKHNNRLKIYNPLLAHRSRV